MLRGRKYENVLGLPEQAGPGRGLAAVGPRVRSSPMFIPLPPPADQTHQRPRTGATTEGVQRRDCSFQPAKEMDRAWEERRKKEGGGQALAGARKAGKAPGPPSQAQQGGQLGSPLGSSRVTGPWGGA